MVINKTTEIAEKFIKELNEDSVSLVLGHNFYFGFPIFYDPSDKVLKWSINATLTFKAFIILEENGKESEIAIFHNDTLDKRYYIAATTIEDGIQAALILLRKTLFKFYPIKNWWFNFYEIEESNKSFGLLTMSYEPTASSEMRNISEPEPKKPLMTIPLMPYDTYKTYAKKLWGTSFYPYSSINLHEELEMSELTDNFVIAHLQAFTMIIDYLFNLFVPLICPKCGIRTHYYIFIENKEPAESIVCPNCASKNK